MMIPECNYLKKKCWSNLINGHHYDQQLKVVIPQGNIISSNTPLDVSIMRYVS